MHFVNMVDDISKEEWKNCFSQWFERMKLFIQCGGEYYEKIQVSVLKPISCLSESKNFWIALRIDLELVKWIAWSLYTASFKVQPYRPALSPIFIGNMWDTLDHVLFIDSVLIPYIKAMENRNLYAINISIPWTIQG